MTGRFKLVIFFGIILSFLVLPKISKAAVDCTATSTTRVPQLECEAIMALYNGTTGSGWVRQTNWNTATDISTWYGITATGTSTANGGHVTILNLNSASSASNNLIGTLPTELGNLTSLTSLTIQKNTQLTGSIPTSIGNLTGLTNLDFSQDQLTGSIPTTTGNLTNLLTLTFLGNVLTGSIPTELSNLTLLTSLTLSSNIGLNGSIPSGFSNLTHLVTLNLAGLSLTGSIPAGLSNTLRTLDVHANQLSGPIPHNIASIPLTSFNFRTNNFVFSDFDADFNSYCSGVTSSVTYNLQAAPDTIRTVNFTQGNPTTSITITPSLSADANDHYQWKFNGVSIPGATSRVYTKANALPSDSGTYTYVVTNTIATLLTLTSNNITLNINPNPPASDSIYYIIDNNSIYVRGNISANKDLAQKYLYDNGGNDNFGFNTAYAISTSTINATSSYVAGTSIATTADDDPPIQTYNIGFLGGNHGLTAVVITSTGHNKDSSDIGSTWSDGSHQFVLASIAGSALTFYSVSSGLPWIMQISAAGTLTHVSGATHTTNITITSQTTVEQYPTISNLVKHILADGVTEVTSTNQGYATYLDLSDEFDLIDPSTIVTSANNPFVWNNGASAWVHIKIVYHAIAGATIVHTTYNIVRPMNLEYFGILQQAGPVAAAYNHQYYYIPKTKPVSIYDFKATQLLDSAPASAVFFGGTSGSTSIDNINNPPDRQMVFFKKNADSFYDLAFAFGYSPYGSTAAANRDCNTFTNCWAIQTNRKSLPVVVGYPGTHGNINNVSYDAWAYRQWVDTSQFDINKSAYWNNQNGHDLVYVDYHRTAANDVTTLPSKYIGKAVTVLESENMQAPAKLIPSDGSLTLSTNGTSTYGYTVLELYNDTTSPSVLITTPTNGATVSGSTVTLTATSSDDIGVASVQFKVDGVNVGSAGSTSPYSISWDSTTATAGSHTISAVATDGSGNASTSTINVTVSNSGPVISGVLATSVTATGAHITWTTNPAADSLVQYGLAANSYSVSSSLDSSLVTSHDVVLTNLQPCSFYHYRVISNDSLNNQSIGSDGSLATIGCTSNAAVIASSTVSANIASSSLVSILSNQLGLDLTIPVGYTLSASSASFQIKQLNSATFFNSVSAPSTYTAVGSYLYNLEALTDVTTSLTTFAVPLTISISYSLSDISGLTESSLVIERYDNGTWTPLTGCTIDTSLHKITCQTSNFSDFSLFGQVATVVSQSTSGSSGAPSSFFQPPIVPIGGFSVNINNGATLANNRTVNLSFNTGSNVTQMVVATNNPTLSLTSLQPYQANYSYDLCSGQASCPDGQYTVYARFYTAYGQSSAIVSKSIELKAGAIIVNQAISQLANRLKGRLLLQVEDGGRIWYVSRDGFRYEATWANALNLFSKLSLGITDKDLQKIPLATSKLSTIFGNKYKGYLFLQVQDHGRIWYVGINGKRYEITFANMLDVFRKLALGITNTDLDKIREGN